MKRSIRTMAIAGIVAMAVNAAPLAMAKEKEKSAANDTSAAKVEEPELQQVTYLGVSVESLHPAFWAHLRDVLEHNQGLLVAQVAKDSPADKAGIKAHDILMTYGNQKLYSPDQLVGLISADKAGSRIKLGIVRNGKPQEISVTLGEHLMQTARMDFSERWRPRWFTSHPSAAQDNAGWESFDSMSLKSLGDNRFKVDIGYETEDGKVVNRTFTGTREQIRNDIVAEKNLPAEERAHLLRSLDMPGADFQLDFPGVYQTPDGHIIWNGRDLDRAFWPVVPSDF